MSQYRTEQAGRFSIHIRVYQPVPQIPGCKWVFEFTPTDENGNELPLIAPNDGDPSDTATDAFAAAVQYAKANLR
ncbi:hypothetical protein ACN9MG_28570 [Burkholderia ambifaria]|jgi:hypothetical protein|uniref:hypothetical protein n=1 Tax=Burkholderia TaxID=32008 RepID=UPI00158C562B|nr:hypothetical protein [Burkholderia ambifaria]